jgi:flagellar basal body-associated protein FliL
MLNKINYRIPLDGSLSVAKDQKEDKFSEARKKVLAVAVPVVMLAGALALAYYRFSNKDVAASSVLSPQNGSNSSSIREEQNPVVLGPQPQTTLKDVCYLNDENVCPLQNLTSYVPVSDEVPEGVINTPTNPDGRVLPILVLPINGPKKPTFLGNPLGQGRIVSIETSSKSLSANDIKDAVIDTLFRGSAVAGSLLIALGFARARNYR